MENVQRATRLSAGTIVSILQALQEVDSHEVCPIDIVISRHAEWKQVMPQNCWEVFTSVVIYRKERKITILWELPLSYNTVYIHK